MSKRVKIADLKFDPENARVRTAKGEAMIQESLRQVGAARSIVIDEDGTILAGNGTVEAAGQIGIDNVVIVEASGDEIIAVRRKGLTDEQKKKLAYYDNRTGDEAEWDMEQVARDLLGGYEFLDELFDNIEVPAPESEGTDELPEDPAEVLREKWGVEYGDLWQIGPHRILCGDSTKKEDVDRLLDGAKPNLMVTDPPYGISVVPKSGSIGGVFIAKTGKYREIVNDNKPFDPSHLWDLADDFVVFGANYFPQHLPYPGQWIVWDKGRPEGTTFSDAEIAWTSGKGIAVKTYRVVWNGMTRQGESGSRFHPTQKPLLLMSEIISDREGHIVIDPYAGSGSTLVAAHNENRTCYAMEIDPAYVAVCIERMAQLGYDPDKVENLEG